MCGIFGYIGPERNLGPDILNALRVMEYRGYDSWGIAVAAGNKLTIRKEVGKTAGVTVDEFPTAALGFGHTRWATHGEVTEFNAHPHVDCTGKIAVIHNGIIVDNFRALRDGLSDHVFKSDTDSEVVAHLIEERMAGGATLLQATADVFCQLEGLNAVIALRLGSNELVAAKKGSPLVVGRDRNGMTTIASDPYALADFASRVHYMEDGQVVRLTPGKVELYDQDLTPQDALMLPLLLESRDLSLGEYAHYMAKEMAEQPEILERLAYESEVAIVNFTHAIKQAFGCFLTGCGTAYHAALTAQYLFSRVAKFHVNAVAGSEFLYHEHFITEDSLVIALSQSGETADIIAAMHAARCHHARLGALVNASNSTLDRLVDISLHLGAGPEQCVLSTKAYTAKVAMLTLIAYAMQGDYDKGRQLVLQAAEGMRQMLQPERVQQIREVAAIIKDAEHLFVIGRGLSYPTALEAALKIKEVSYIHAEGFAAGELKHGVIALIEKGTPCIVYAPNDETRADVLSGAMELKTRGGFIIGIGPQYDEVFDIHLATPDVGDASPLVNALPAQQLGYHLALLRGYDPDKPRNLAKSVTVK